MRRVLDRLGDPDRLLDREAQQPQSAAPAPGPPPEPPPRSPYRPCAVCGQLMVRRNFGRTSGVIVDFCGSHGIWFDAQELAHVLRWIRSGNLEAARVDLAACDSLLTWPANDRLPPVLQRTAPPRVSNPPKGRPTSGTIRWPMSPRASFGYWDGCSDVPKVGEDHAKALRRKALTGSLASCFEIRCPSLSFP